MEHEPRRRRRGEPVNSGSYPENASPHLEDISTIPPEPQQTVRPVQHGTSVTEEIKASPKKGRAATGHRIRRRAAITFSLIAFAVLLALIVLISPKEPNIRAQYTTGSPSGLVQGGSTGPDSAYIGLRISEVMTANKSAVPDSDGNHPDWVEVWNSTDHAIDLSGVGLSDRGDSIRFIFPNVSLAPNGRTVVFCDDTNASDPDRDFHAKFKLSSVGETVYLYDTNAYLIDSVSVPISATNESYALIDGKYEMTPFFSPGFENSEAGYLQYLTASTVTDGAILINEIMADPCSGLADEDGEFVDWVELYNTTDSPVLLDNYALSDNEGKPLQWRFPKGAVIPAHGYYIVFCSGKDRNTDPTVIPHTNFRISAQHDTVVLSDNRGRLIDRVTIDNLPRDCSWGRLPDGSFIVFRLATPSLPNTQAGENTMDYNMRQMNASGVYITEVCASNDTITAYSKTVFRDWVELYNSTQTTVDLSGYGLSDRINRPRKWTFPQGTTIGPGEYKVIVCDGSVNGSSPSELHASFKINRTGCETIVFSDPTGRVLDKLNLPVLRTDITYGRSLGLAGFFYYDVPTPFAANQTDGFQGYAEEPVFTGDQPGLLTSAARITMSIPQGTTVYYTTDGSIPTRSSTRYNGETLEFSFTTVVRARAISDTGTIQPSNILTGTFLVNAFHSLPVVSLVTDPDVLWNPNTGFLVTGENVVKVAGQLPFKNTVYREFGKIPQPCHVEYYRLDGSTVFSQDLGFELAGDYSLDMPQKSMKFRTKSIYGSKTVQAALFDDREFTEYKGFVLRNSGNDCMWTRLQDGFQSRLLDAWGASVIHQAWNPVVVYINGIYWGTMNMRERVDKFFVAQHEGLTFEQAQNITIIQGSGKAKTGSNKEYKAMLSKIKQSDPAKNPDDLQYILNNVDVDNYFEYIALEMFVGNSDIGNLKCYKTGEPGSKWKWIFYDVDYGLYNSEFNSPWSYTKDKGMGQKNIDNTILKKLLTVPEYKAMFLRKLGSIFQYLTTDKMLQVLEPLVQLIEPEMSLHWARWGEENDRYVISEVPVTSDGAYRYWQQRVNRLRNVVKKRPHYLWGFIQDSFKLSNDEMLDYFGPRPEKPADAV